MSGQGAPPVRPCPTCECFVPAAATRCPRCEVALEPIPVADPVEPAEPVVERELVLVGAGVLASPLTGSGHAEAPRRVIQPKPRPTLAKRPPSPGTDPLVLAVVLGIPMEPSVAAPELAPVPDPAPEPAPAPERFSALLGTDDLLPTTPVAAAVAVEVESPTLVAIPITPAAQPETIVRPVRRVRGDPFARRTTQRERMLTRVCMTLAISLAIAILVLRLPLGARPELSASNAGVGTTAPTTTPFSDAIRLQTQADLTVVAAQAATMYPVFNTFRVVTPVILARKLPQFAFVSGKNQSHSVGTMSVATSTNEIVVAEYAGPGHCTFARVVRSESAQTVGPIVGPCHASSSPTQGWTRLEPDA